MTARVSTLQSRAGADFMRALPLRLDIRQSRSRTRRTMAASLVLHAAIIAWLALIPRTDTTSPPLTEITLLDLGDLSPAPAPRGEPAPGPQATRGEPSAKSPDVRFVRRTETGEMTPAPTSWTAFGDRLNHRLAALQTEAQTHVQGVSPSVGVGPSWGPAGVHESPGGTGHAGTVSLNRGGGGSGPPVALTRGGGGLGASPALATIPSPEQSAADAPARSSESNARRNLAGATLMGPIADRAILSMVKPTYPEWAKRDAVEGSVTLYFVVRPDGSVKENVMVQKTAGFEEFDDSARSALKDWRFEALRGGRTGEQWGTITFHFRLRDAG